MFNWVAIKCIILQNVIFKRKTPSPFPKLETQPDTWAVESQQHLSVPFIPAGAKNPNKEKLKITYSVLTLLEPETQGLDIQSVSHKAGLTVVLCL